MAIGTFAYEKKLDVVTSLDEKKVYENEKIMWQTKNSRNLFLILAIIRVEL